MAADLPRHMAIVSVRPIEHGSHAKPSTSFKINYLFVFVLFFLAFHDIYFREFWIIFVDFVFYLYHNCTIFLNVS